MRVSKTAILVTAAVIAGAGFAGVAYAQASNSGKDTPFNYVLKKGKPVTKPTNRVTNADGTWREETRRGNGCVEIKEKTAAGYREFRECPTGPSGN